jgi:hypothetical protein
MRMCPPDSVFFFSDVDEIPRPESLLQAVDLAKADPKRCVRLSMPMFYGRGDLRVRDPKGDGTKAPDNWTCGTIVLHEHLEMTPSQIRMNPNDLVVGDCDAGWHFSWMGDSERMKRKVTSFSHCFDDVPNAVAPCDSADMLQHLDNYKAQAGGTDPLGRTDHILEPYPHELLPPELFKLDRVRNYLLPA